MATPNNYDARGIIDFLSKLNPEMANVLNGEAMVTRIKEEFKNQSEEGRKAAERMAKNLRNSGNNISAARSTAFCPAPSASNASTRLRV